MRHEFKKEQRGVALAMAGALATTVGVLSIVVMLDDTAAPVPFEVRLQSALRADLFVVAWLAVAIANVARLRFFSEDDIACGHAGPGSAKARQASAILQNTLEQVGLAIAAHMMVAATFNQSQAIVPALVCLFVIGRFFFWTGYKNGARSRAFGFALTFYPSVLAIIAASIAALLGSAT